MLIFLSYWCLRHDAISSGQHQPHSPTTTSLSTVASSRPSWHTQPHNTTTLGPDLSAGFSPAWRDGRSRLRQNAACVPPSNDMCLPVRRQVFTRQTAAYYGLSMTRKGNIRPAPDSRDKTRILKSLSFTPYVDSVTSHLFSLQEGHGLKSHLAVTLPYHRSSVSPGFLGFFPSHDLRSAHHGLYIRPILPSATIDQQRIRHFPEQQTSQILSRSTLRSEQRNAGPFRTSAQDVPVGQI